VVHHIEITLLTVGLNGKSNALDALPIRVISTESGGQAIEWLRKNHFIKALISTWDLPDMNEGELVRRIKAVRPWLPTVVLLDKPFQDREVAARSLGVSAVLPSNVEGPLLVRIMGQILECETKASSDEPSDYLYKANTEI
jgi:DNA-binding NtrC family response regulator